MHKTISSESSYLRMIQPHSQLFNYSMVVNASKNIEDVVKLNVPDYILPNNVSELVPYHPDNWQYQGFPHDTFAV